MNKFFSGVFLQPHPAKVKKGGEDAALVTDNILAVADGVGGWADSGIDPAKYSRQLCTNFDDLVRKDEGKGDYVKDPQRLLIDGVELTRETGSCTVCIASLALDEPQLLTANLGDSGFLHLRKNGLDLVSIFRSQEQQHSFNFPYQVGTGGDDPAKAESKTHEVCHNDILVLGTDGLFDNLFDVRIIELIKPFVRSTDDLLDPTIVAEIVAKEAEKFSRN